jgi:DNA-binding FrmR family transcriptional regulator
LRRIAERHKIKGAQMTKSIAFKKMQTKESKKSKLNSPAHDHSVELRRLSRIKGQVEGVEKMIVEKRNCPDIVIQIKAIRSALHALETNIVQGHMNTCVTTAIKSRDPIIVKEKFDEILLLLKRQS